jgi:phosphinothricin acetyltransferase
MIRACVPGDAARICDIYNYFVRDTVVTFDESPVDETDMARRIAEVTARLPWLVWESAEGILGYAYASPWKTRAAYRHAVEASIYLAPLATGRGLGTRLYEALIEDLRNRDLHCVIGGAALPNPASAALHAKLGFTKVAEFKQVGYKFGRWIDVAYWELVL